MRSIASRYKKGIEMNELTTALYELSVSRETVTEDNAKRIFTAIIRKLNSLLNAKLIRVYKKVPTQDGVVIEPFVWNPDVNPAPMRISFNEEPNGMLSWAYHHKQILWIEEIETEDQDEPILNKATGEYIEAVYRKFSYDPKSMIVVPLISQDQEGLFGVFAIELDVSGKFTQALCDEITDTGHSFTRILDKLNTYERNLSHAERTVETFLTRILEMEFEGGLLSANVKSGLMIRPYGEEFDRIGSRISEYFSDKGVLVEHYQPRMSDEVVILDLVEAIRTSYFCVVDITKQNLNVFLELGVIIAMDKPFILLQDTSDSSEPLFDISSYNAYKYEFERRENRIDVWKPGTREPISFESFLDIQIEEVNRKNPSFENAAQYIAPENDSKTDE